MLFDLATFDRREEDLLDRLGEYLGDLECKREARVVATVFDRVDCLTRHVESVRQVGLTPAKPSPQLTESVVQEDLDLSANEATIHETIPSPVVICTY